jgi:DNA polymerase III subunit beta
MAQQDVRYYLNGLLLDLRDELRCVATDGHRLALCEADLSRGPQARRKQIIVPRKGVLELQRLLENSDREIELEVGRSHVRVRRDDVTFTSKLIDGRFPDYEAVIPIGADKRSEGQPRGAARRAAARGDPVQREVPRRAHRGRPGPAEDRVAHNPEQEEAVEEVEAETSVDGWRSVSTSITCWRRCRRCATRDVVMQLRDANSSALVREASSERSRHVVMPLRL